jgi:hypothetical protein
VVRDSDHQLTVLLSGARIGCALSGAIGAAIFVGAITYEGLVWRVFGAPASFAFVAGVVPAALGVYATVRALLRARTLGRVARGAEPDELPELAMRWGRPALRVVFADGDTATFSTGAVDRGPLVDAIRRRAIAHATPAARLLEK